MLLVIENELKNGENANELLIMYLSPFGYEQEENIKLPYKWYLKIPIIMF